MAGVSDSEFEQLPECEPAWLRRHRAAACRRRLLAAGYSPLPVNGKAPPAPAWQDIVATNDIISAWEDKYPDATNTGILTGNTPAIDIDVLNSDVADEVQQIAERLIGTSAVRTGQAPKRAMLFRTDEPFDKVSTPIFISPDGRTHKVEILGRGQQIVVDGIHPDTHSPYTWQGGEPGSELNRDALPQLNAEQAKEFIVAATQCMSGYGWSPKKKPNGDAGGSWNAARPASERERVYARAALDGCADEVAKAATGERNDTLNKKAFRLGTMVARGWIQTEEVCDALLAAADACGLNSDDGEGLTRRTIQSGLESGKKFPHPDLSPAFTEGPAVSRSWKYYTGEATTADLSGDAWLRGLVRSVANATEGQRNSVLFWASCRAGAAVRDGKAAEVFVIDVLVEAAKHAGLPEREAQRTVQSGMRQP